ncbi:peptidoglycan/xylan/chitin deacetylase (PgdA/CDA1 family) [Flavobacterium sp. CG_9.10]|uniref:polysaccharide deacetylase family protein n=1 Tax=Flavobacterium sp. CG_9.10 TaxID=2787729 RepID=UPI0018C9A650|nr:polysaccharide deacetylase family protein [Flavobacterium sp. CG_9.10]MBG6111722.1 peptidoglycan/xylan/chitin deacetylase (PgdA/CDA1 family) [Flavobacterium sp. CG_9.10]
MKKSAFLVFSSIFLLASCNTKSDKPKTEAAEATETAAVVTKTTPQKTTANDAAKILSKKEVPILCYHNIKELKAGDGEMTKTYTVSPANFAQQMKALSDAGYHSILPNQLYDYLVYDAPLPSNPVMITFDDTRGEQFSIGAAEMKKYGFKGVFFVMTVSINRPGYLSKEQIKSLSDSGNVVAAHTWDHHMVTKYAGDDWNTQLVKPKAKLEEIIGKPVTYFAYPFGLWNKAAIPEIKKSGYQMAYILATKRDSVNPLYTIRRIIVAGQWSTPSTMEAIKSSFY